MTWALLAVSYFVGAFPTSYVVGRLARGIDLRQHGSGNLGATNAFRVLGWRAALPIFLVDIFKGFAPTFFFPRWDGSPHWEWALAYGAAAILGHVYSAYVGFRGGKGVATSAGVFLALAPVAVGVGLVVWALLVWTTRIVSVASIAAAVAVPLAVLLTTGVGPVLWLSLALGAFIIYAHRQNIRRLLRGEEHRFGRKAPEAR
ncbi:MAG TPA: glycerol-3-phosphate 1-O-acyltransferase PlsY [Longimicrobiales bacterium]|nr:glycerol-3-phosphate 1-O-acyltransferase PlsY [Longimicrobiales bacterium]